MIFDICDKLTGSVIKESIPWFYHLVLKPNGSLYFRATAFPKLLIINKTSTFKVTVENVHMVYALNMYPLDVTNVVCSFSKKGERFLVPHKLYLKQLLILQLNNDDKRKHHRILKHLHCTMIKFDVVG